MRVKPSSRSILPLLRCAAGGAALSLCSEAQIRPQFPRTTRTAARPACTIYHAKPGARASAKSLAQASTSGYPRRFATAPARHAQYRSNAQTPTDTAVARLSAIPSAKASALGLPVTTAATRREIPATWQVSPSNRAVSTTLTSDGSRRVASTRAQETANWTARSASVPVVRVSTRNCPPNAR